MNNQMQKVSPFNAANFKTADKWWDNIFDGSAVGGAKLPIVKSLAKDHATLLVGFKDVPGCFTVQQLLDKLDVAFYEDSAAEIDKRWTETGDYVSGTHMDLTCHNGWGFMAIEILVEFLVSWEIESVSWAAMLK